MYTSTILWFILLNVHLIDNDVINKMRKEEEKTHSLALYPSNIGLIREFDLYIDG